MANQTSTIKIEKIEIMGRDFYDAFTSCSIYEDIFTNSWSGHIDISETESIRESMPIIGEEIIFIQFASRKPVSGAVDQMVQFIGRVTKLDNYREGNAQKRNYRLHFQSIWAEVNKAKRCRKSYEGTASEIAATIIDAQIGTELKTIDPAKFTEKFIFPNWSPFQCINYLATKSVSEKYGDPYYLFYEDRDGYHFTTLSQMMDKEKVETIKTKLIQNMDDETADEVLTSVIQLSPLFDTLETAEMGMYGGTLITYDKVNKAFKEETATYSETYDKFIHAGKEKLTVMRAESPKNRFQFIMANETENPGVYANGDEWALEGMIRAPQVRGHRAQLFLNRSTDFKLGDLLEWDIKVTADSAEADKILSGNWMIARIHHRFNHINYNAFIEMIKDGIG